MYNPLSRRIALLFFILIPIFVLYIALGYVYQVWNITEYTLFGRGVFALSIVWWIVVALHVYIGCRENGKI